MMQITSCFLLLTKLRLQWVVSSLVFLLVLGVSVCDFMSCVGLIINAKHRH